MKYGSMYSWKYYRNSRNALIQWDSEVVDKVEFEVFSDWMFESVWMDEINRCECVEWIV